MRSILTITLIAAAMAVPAQANLTMFLYLHGIDGDAADDGHHKDWLDVYSFHVSLQQVADVGGGRGRGVSFSDFHLAGPISKASPQLFLHTCNGRAISHARLDIVTSVLPGMRDVVAYWEFDDAIVTSYATSSSWGDGALTDSYSLGFRRITYGYIEYADDGRRRGTIEVGWDLEHNQQTMAMTGVVEHFQFITPEPGTMGILLLGGAVAVLRKRRCGVQRPG